MSKKLIELSKEETNLRKRLNWNTMQYQKKLLKKTQQLILMKTK